MFICDCHCDTLTELYKKGTSLYDNDQHFDIKRQIELGGGLQFCAIFVPTHESVTTEDCVIRFASSTNISRSLKHCRRKASTYFPF